MRLASYLTALLRVNNSRNYLAKITPHQSSNRAESGNRTHDLTLTMGVLCLLSYSGKIFISITHHKSILMVWRRTRDSNPQPFHRRPLSRRFAFHSPILHGTPKCGAQSRKRESNPQPFPYKGSALPIELFRHTSLRCSFSNVTTYGITLSNHCSILLCASDGT